MNKKIILASLVLFSAIPILASAIVSYGIVQNDEVPAREVVYGSPSDIPYIRSSFKLYKGWNLIPSPGEGVAAPERTKATFFGYPRQMGCGVKENDFSGYQVKYMYAHVPGRGYIGGKVNYNNNGFESSVQQEFENATRAFYLSPEMGGNNGIWSLHLTSRWVYSDIECEYRNKPTEKSSEATKYHYYPPSQEINKMLVLHSQILVEPTIRNHCYYNSLFLQYNPVLEHEHTYT